MENTEHLHQITNEQESVRPATSWQTWLRQVWLIALIYIFATWFTNAHFMADTGGYVVSILAYNGVSEYVAENPVVRDYHSENPFWDFGHLLWRPLGLVLYKTLGPLSKLIVGSDPGINVVFLLLVLNFVAGLVSILLLHALIMRITGNLLAANLAAIAFIFSHGFLNFAQTGSAYIAGLAFLLSGIYILVKNRDRLTWKHALFAGLSFVGAVCMWFLYILVIPAAIAAPLFLIGTDRSQRRLVFQTATTFALAAMLAYGMVMAYIGVHTPTDLRAWINGCSHGVITSGASRVAFGLPRSLINMGNDGVLFKRFLLHDPFNPVSVFDLFRLSLWKLALFYLALGSIIFALLLTPRGRKIFFLLLFSAIPLLAFAAKYDGGAVERYLPLYPLIFLLLAWLLSAERIPRLLKVAPLAFVAAAIITNLSAMATSVLNREQQEMAARIEGLLPQLKPESRVVTTHLQDDLVNFQASFPFHPDNRHGAYRVYPILVPNSSQVVGWREAFATEAMDIWVKGGDLWVSKRVLNSIPQPEWNWTEGDDRRVSWNDLNAFFSGMEMGQEIGGADGFALLLRSANNQQVLGRFGQSQIIGVANGISETKGESK